MENVEIMGGWKPLRFSRPLDHSNKNQGETQIKPAETSEWRLIPKPCGEGRGGLTSSKQARYNIVCRPGV